MSFASLSVAVVADYGHAEWPEKSTGLIGRAALLDTAAQAGHLR
jgi:hypothetical protein